MIYLIRIYCVWNSGIELFWFLLNMNILGLANLTFHNHHHPECKQDKQSRNTHKLRPYAIISRNQKHTQTILLINRKKNTMHPKHVEKRTQIGSCLISRSKATTVTNIASLTRKIQTLTMSPTTRDALMGAKSITYSHFARDICTILYPITVWFETCILLTRKCIHYFSTDITHLILYVKLYYIFED